MTLVAANHYVVHGAVHGTIDTTSLGGAPAISLAFEGRPAQDPSLTESAYGLEVSALIEAIPDTETTSLLLFLPQVNLAQGDVHIDGVALLVTSRSTVGGPGLVSGPIESYHTHHVRGTASVVAR